MKKSLILLLGLSLSLLLFAGCSDDEEDSGTTNPDARPASELQDIADQAATDSGLTDFTTIDATNADTLSNEVTMTAEEAGGQMMWDATNGAVNLTAANIVAAKALRRAVASLRAKAGRTSGGAANYLTTDYPVIETMDCSTSGTAALTGTITITDNGDEFPDTDRAGFIFTEDKVYADMATSVVGCDDGYNPFTVWGSQLYNSTESMTITFTSDTEATFTMASDEYTDGGFAATDGTNNYNFSLSTSMDFSASGTMLMTDPDTEPSMTVETLNATATVKVNDITCTLSSTDITLMESDGPPPMDCS